MLFIIDDDTPNDVLFPVIDGEPKGRGLVPRDYSLYPEEMYAPPSDIKLVPKSEWSDRIKELKRTGSRLSDIRRSGNKGGPIPSLDQGQDPYCWSHSATHAAIVVRAIMNQPYVPLSAFAVAAIIKRGQQEGGWCGLSQKFLREVGIPSQKLWPQGSRDLRLDTPAMRADAAKRKVTEEWVDLTRAVYDQNLTFEMLASCLLSGVPCAVDFHWWSHSVCALDLVEVEPGSFGIDIWNSWGDTWGDQGIGTLRGSKAIPNGAVGVRVSNPIAA